ncbi:MAG: DUF6160 family protein [Pseudomonadota bacterium]
MRAPLPMMLRAVCAAAALACLSGAPAQAMEPLGDAALSAVRGRDGVSFDLSGFAMSGDVRVTYTAPGGASAYMESLSAARSDNRDPFADPYRLDIVPGAPGLADVVQFAFPRNAQGEQRWQLAYDWGVSADGVARDNGSVVIGDLAFYGGGLQFSTPQARDGVAFGAALRFDIGQLAYRPHGRADASEQMAFSGIHLGGVDAAGNFNNTPWVLADVAAQPGVINAVADAGGPRLHIGIDWPDARYGSGAASMGGLQVDNISFNSPNGGSVDLGSSRIGSMQIQYLDIKFRR